MNNIANRLSHTYQLLYRDRHVIARNLKLTDSEYRLWDMFIALYDWDKRHTNSFGVIYASDREIAQLLSGCNWSASKVCRTKNNLVKKGLINKTDRKKYSLTILTKQYIFDSKMQQQVPPPQQNISDLQQPVSDMQQNRSSSGINIVSFKDEYKFIRDGKYLTEEQYKGLHKITNKFLTEISGKFFDTDEKIQEKVREFERLAQLMLDYEIEHDLLPIGKGQYVS